MAGRKFDTNMHRHTSGSLAIIVVLIILYFGLWPKSPFMENNIDWLPELQAIDFRESGVAYLNDLNSAPTRQEFREFTIDLRIAAHNVRKRGFRPILMIHGGSDKEQMTVWQWGSSIIAMNGDDYSYRRKLPRVSAYDVLAPGRTVTVTLSSADHSTRLYINGELAAENRTWQISIPKSGEKLHFILGNSVHAKHGWQGLVYSISMHNRALSRDEILRLHENAPSPALSSEDAFQDSPYLLLYRTHKVHDTPVEQSIHIPIFLPERVIILKKNVLAAPWHHFSLSRNLVIDIVLNFLGFIPFGALLYLHLKNFSKSADFTVKIAALAGCFLLSLVIEIGQIWQLTRYSSLLDLLLNTSGGYAGVLLVSGRKLLGQADPLNS